MESGFQILEHPADVGIEATGSSLREAFENAALGLLSLITEPATIDPLEERRIKVTASDYQGLLVKWLSEILYLFDAEEFLVGEVTINLIAPTGLEATVLGEKLNQEKHELKLDVKAITYHQLKIEENKSGCKVRVFVDI